MPIPFVSNPLGIVKTLQQRTWLGYLQLKHDPTRLLTAIAGITFADILIFLQLGFSDALYTTNTQYPRSLQTDLVVLSTQAESFSNLSTFARSRLYQAQDVPGVASADALYIGSTDWQNPQTLQDASMMVLGQDLDRPAFDLPEVNQQLGAVRIPNSVLFDQAARGEYQTMLAQVNAGETVTSEIGVQTVTVAGLFEVGASFADDGALMTSQETFLRLFPRRSAGAVSLGLIRLEPGYTLEKVQAGLEARLPDDVQVMDHESYVEFELNEIKAESPIGFVFGLGAAMGFIVGIVIVYQVLSTDVNSHLGEYATFRAMGYRNLYLLGVIFEEALILSVLGFIPGVLVSLVAYQITAAATALPLAMPLSRCITVFVLTLVMCNASGAVATRRLQSADPADIF
ncbi:MAG: ABC transporter permease DevC [Elainellaceae cyanobacterium]